MKRVAATKTRGEQGQSLLEFALVLPVLVFIFMGMFDIGRLIFVYAQLLNSAREGARYGSVSGVNEAAPQYLDCQGIRTAAIANQGIALRWEQIDIQYDNGTVLYSFDCDDTPGLNALRRGDRVRVTVTTEMSVLTPVLSTMFPPRNVSFTAARTILRGGTLIPPGSR